MAQMDFVCAMYAKDHPDEYKLIDTAESKEKAEIIEEQRAWWDIIKNPETRRAMLYGGRRPVIPSAHLKSKLPSGVITGVGGKPIDLAAGDDIIAKLKSGG